MLNMNVRQRLDDMPQSAPCKLSHIVLRSANVPAMRDWYVAALNARVVFEGEGGTGCGLTFDEEHHRIAIIGMPPGDVAKQHAIGDFFAQIDKRREMSGLEHVSFTFDGLGKLFSQYRRLKKQGIEPVMTVNHGAVMSMYYLDPDGNNVELQTDTLPMDQAFEFMYSPAFAENSVGAPYDPEELCDMYEAGVPLAEIAQYGWKDQ
jgi:catechol 2,3-dioxygenase-like lactoylglutathione lyase family enzyme